MDIKTCNRLAVAMLVTAKVFGVLGLVIGVVNRLVGGTLLALDGVLLLAAVIFVLGNRRRESTEAQKNKAVLEQMVREGTLEKYLREIRASKAAAAREERDEDERGPSSSDEALTPAE